MKRLFTLLILLVVGVIGFKILVKNSSNPAEVSLAEVEEVSEEMLQPLEPRIDQIHRLFTTGPNKLPIVETITYTPRVEWLEGRAAWIADYASYYNTSRHFIARSLNGKADYYTQKVSHNDRFNVFRKDVNFEFNLVVDLSACEMDFYYKNLDTGERELIKTYPVGVGRPDPSSPSGSLTPTGTFRLGSKVAIYKPGITGTYQDNEIEMMQVFGTRWIPIGEPVGENCYSDAKGCGIHASPWIPDPETGELVEQREMIGQHPSSGCIRMHTEDIEELFSIVISKPTTIEIVNHVNP